MVENQDGEDAADGVSYSYRPSVMGGVCTFRAAPDALHWSIGKHNGVLPYGAIRRIRLSFKPMSLANYRFQAEIWSDGLPKILVSSTSWKSIFEQERRDQGYLAFIRTLHAELARGDHAPLLETGSPPFIYWPGVAATALVFAVLPVVIYRTIAAGATGAALLIGLFMAYVCWQLGSFFYRNRPTRYAAESLPLQVLPSQS